MRRANWQIIVFSLLMIKFAFSYNRSNDSQIIAEEMEDSIIFFLVEIHIRISRSADNQGNGIGEVG